MSKPKVILNCVASHYNAKDERTIEFISTDKSLDYVDGMNYAGGLINFRHIDGKLYVFVFRCDENVVISPEPKRTKGHVQIDAANLKLTIKSLHNLIEYNYSDLGLSTTTLLDQIELLLKKIDNTLDQYYQCTLSE
jgi:hypothetical protein